MNNDFGQDSYRPTSRHELKCHLDMREPACLEAPTGCCHQRHKDFKTEVYNPVTNDLLNRDCQKRNHNYHVLTMPCGITLHSGHHQEHHRPTRRVRSLKALKPSTSLSFFDKSSVDLLLHTATTSRSSRASQQRRTTGDVTTTRPPASVAEEKPEDKTTTLIKGKQPHVLTFSRGQHENMHKDDSTINCHQSCSRAQELATLA